MKKRNIKQEIEAEFLEKANLYQRKESNLPHSYSDLKGESINLFCKICNSNQTFILKTPWFEGKNLWAVGRPKSVCSSYVPHKENIKGFLLLDYECAKCKQERAIFLIGISNKKIQKVGQYPPIGISTPEEIKVLKDKTIEDLYKKGRICESQSYGIGAFVYYRRIVELKIDELLKKITEFFPKDKRKGYEEELEKIKKEKNADKKIHIVKGIITDEVIQNNPLKEIYSILSEGIHSLTDEKCLELAQSLRELIILLIKQIDDKKKDKKRLISAQKNLAKIKRKQGEKK